MSWVAGLLLLLGLVSACSTDPPVRLYDDLSLVPKLGIRPLRIAVLFPPTKDPTLVYTYARLETMTDHLLREAMGSRIVDRRDLTSIHTEQGWQYAAPASEETSVRLGRLSGADTLVLYRILSPTLRERLFAPEGALSSVTIIGKVIRVETGEVVWNHLVSVNVRPPDRWQGAGFGLDTTVRQALEHGVNAMEAALTHAVRCANQDCLVGVDTLHPSFPINMVPTAPR